MLVIDQGCIFCAKLWQIHMYVEKVRYYAHCPRAVSWIVDTTVMKGLINISKNQQVVTYGI